MLTIKDLDFSYPSELIAIKPQYPPRVMKWGNLSPEPSAAQGEPQEIAFSELLHLIPAGDLLVVNNTRVLPRKIKVQGLEILFIEKVDSANHETWSVLMPSQKLKVGDEIPLPGGATLKLLEKGLPQKVISNQILTDEYFASWGSLALPPYILKQRAELSKLNPGSFEFSSPENENAFADDEWYQPLWQKLMQSQENKKDGQGSLASPTASLHFKEKDFETLKNRGVQVLPITLHVGLGTFLPIKTEKISEHQMHFEWVEIPTQTWQQIQLAKKEGRKVWALGTTVARSLESVPKGILKAQSAHSEINHSQSHSHQRLEIAHSDLKPSGASSEICFFGLTNLFIQPGHDWQIVDRLLTNFHQPQSTLLALVASIAGLEQTLQAYQWAIQNRFRLFSYGDLSLWIQKK